MIASEVPGTTRDSIAVDLERDGRKYRLIDTAGLRRRARVEEAVEKFSAFKTLQAIEQCQVAVLMLDASEGVTDQDATVLGAVLDAGRALVIVLNKWDGRTDYERQQAEALVARKLSFVDWAERVRISALHGSGLRELFKAIHRAHASATHVFSTADVTRAVEAAYDRQSAAGGARPRRQAALRASGWRHAADLRRARHPPEDAAATTYQRYLENFFRKRFKLVGTPIRFVFREGSNPYEGKKNVLTERQIEKKRRLIRHVKRGG